MKGVGQVGVIQVGLVGELEPANRFRIFELEVGEVDLHLSQVEFFGEAFHNVGKGLVVRERQAEEDLQA
jgi:hypothetical protein